MAIKCSVFIATSLDGFIAREDGNLDWLLNATTSKDDHGYAAFISSIDTIVIGRKTFEIVLTFVSWPYTGKRVVVLSETMTSKDLHAKFAVLDIEFHKGSIPELVNHLQQTGSKHVFVDGGRVIQSFLNANLLDDMVITRIPILIGKGIPLFDNFTKDIKLKHLKTQSYESGFVQSKYSVVGIG